jgi:hypothetical protein
MKRLGTALIILGVAALIPTGAITWKDTKRSRGFDEKVAELTTQRAGVRDQLRATNLEYRGYQRSIPSMPDSTRKQVSGQIMEAYRNYNKKIRLLENQEREFTRLILRQQAMKGERNARLVRWMAGLGGAGILVAAAGVILVRRA